MLGVITGLGVDGCKGLGLFILRTCGAGVLRPDVSVAGVGSRQDAVGWAESFEGSGFSTSPAPTGEKTKDVGATGAAGLLGDEEFGEAEFVVEGGEGALHGAFLNDEGNVVLAGALSDGHDVHIFAAQGGEGAAGDAGDAAHVVADSSDDGDVGIGVDVLDGLLGDFGGEGVAEGGDGALFVGSGDEEADVVLGRGLRDEEDVGSGGGGGGEAAGEDVGEADDAGAADGDHGDVFDGGEGFYTA